MNLASLRAHGFDLSKHVPFSKNYRLGCSCCNPVAINGYHVHERGCPNDMHECAGCNALVPAGVRYCGDCA